jgi:hypothetical protein
MKRALVAISVGVVPLGCQMMLHPVDPARGDHTSAYCSKEIGALLVDGSLFGGGLAGGLADTQLDFRVRATLLGIGSLAAYSTYLAVASHRGVFTCLVERYSNRTDAAWTADHKPGEPWGMCRMDVDPPCGADLLCQDADVLPSSAPRDMLAREMEFFSGVCVPRDQLYAYCSAASECPDGTWCDTDVRFPDHPHGTCVPDPHVTDPLAPVERHAHPLPTNRGLPLMPF